MKTSVPTPTPGAVAIDVVSPNMTTPPTPLPHLDGCCVFGKGLTWGLPGVVAIVIPDVDDVVVAPTSEEPPTC